MSPNGTKLPRGSQYHKIPINTHTMKTKKTYLLSEIATKLEEDLDKAKLENLQIQNKLNILQEELAVMTKAKDFYKNSYDDLELSIIVNGRKYKVM